MLHQPNLNSPAITPGKLTAEDFAPQPAEAATDVGTDEALPGDGSERRLGAFITAACALVTVAVALLGYWLKVTA